jgi:hypothetical protein
MNRKQAESLKEKTWTASEKVLFKIEISQKVPLSRIQGHSTYEYDE